MDKDAYLIIAPLAVFLAFFLYLIDKPKGPGDFTFEKYVKNKDTTSDSK